MCLKSPNERNQSLSVPAIRPSVNEKQLSLLCVTLRAFFLLQCVDNSTLVSMSCLNHFSGLPAVFIDPATDNDVRDISNIGHVTMYFPGVTCSGCRSCLEVVRRTQRVLPSFLGDSGESGGNLGNSLGGPGYS